MSRSRFLCGYAFPTYSANGGCTSLRSGATSLPTASRGVHARRVVTTLSGGVDGNRARMSCLVDSETAKIFRDAAMAWLITRLYAWNLNQYSNGPSVVARFDGCDSRIKS